MSFAVIYILTRLTFIGLTCENFVIVEAQCQGPHRHHLGYGAESEVLLVLHSLHVLQTHGRMPAGSTHSLCMNDKHDLARLGTFLLTQLR